MRFSLHIILVVDYCFLKEKVKSDDDHSDEFDASTVLSLTTWFPIIERTK